MFIGEIKLHSFIH